MQEKKDRAQEGEENLATVSASLIEWLSYLALLVGSHVLSFLLTALEIISPSHQIPLSSSLLVL